MSVLRCRAPGKVNLCLHVGRPRADRLHPLVSVMQPLSLADDVALQPDDADRGRDTVACPGVTGPNLAGEALARFRALTGWDAPAQRITIDKRIPVAAGMGGGSADAAAVLRLAAAASGRSAEDPELASLAAGLGSDVPAALAARRCLVAGVGERVEPLPDPQPFSVLVLPSSETLSTPAVYAEFDRLGLGRSQPELEALESAIRAGAGGPAATGPEGWVNDLAPAARSLCRSIDAALEDVRAAGADVAMVSGSGPTVVGVFLGREARRRAGGAAGELAGRHPRAVVAEPVPAGWADARAASADGRLRDNQRAR